MCWNPEGDIMYTLCLKKDFIARHFLIGGDWGDENQPHAHHYDLELRLSAGDLDSHQYLVDLVDVERHLENTIAIYRDSMLNEQKTFSGRNPSLELFARILWDHFVETLTSDNIENISIRLWENDSAWAEWSGSPR